MLGIQIRKPRFNLYHLDEGEIFIKEFAANCQFVYPETETIENLQGVLIIASRSLIFESDDHNFSMIKFHFRNIPDKPKILNLESKEVFKFLINKMIEIPKGKVIQPYITHELKSDLYVSILHEKIEIVAQILYELFDRFYAKQNVFEFDSIEYLANLYSFKFDYTRIKSINEKFLIKKELFVKQILPLIEVPGLLMLTDARIYFQPIYALSAKKCYSYKYENTNKLFKRKIKLKDIGLEICTSKNKNLLLQFDSESERETIYDLIFKNTSSDCETNFNIEKYTKLWLEGKLTNYDYLIALNSVANRTRNDLSQYPVFPWVIGNYESSFLDLNDIKNFRDLSKPIGALNPKRLESFRERYRLMPDPKFLYGTHYSNPAYVIGYLVRKFPQFMLKLHGGRFDHPDRLFSAIDVDWHICLTNPASLKELTPEFYEENSEFLLNLQNVELGVSNKNEKINHVKLPLWANDPVDFLKKMREALESNYVSNHLHEWIDLIFGYKQTGPASLEADNVFHPITYENNTELANTHDPISRRALEIQITEYGQTPKQIFFKPHPKRFTNNKLSDNSMKENSLGQALKQINFTEKDFELVQNLDENLLGASHIHIKLPNENIKNIEYDSDAQVQKDLLDNDEQEDNLKYEEKNYFENIETSVKFNIVPKYHKKKINTGLVQQEYNQILTAGEDGYLKVFDLEAHKAKRMHSISSIALTSMTLLNQPNIVAIGSVDNMIYIFNTIVGKQVNNFFAHEDTITKIFFSPNKNLLISNSNDSTYKIWDMAKNSKLPLNCFYDSDSAIVSADFRQTDNLHICLNEDGNVFIRNILNEKELKKIRVPKNNFNFIKFNALNKNQFFLSSEDSFKVYDIKEGREIDSINAFANCVDINLDSNKFLVTFPDSIKTYARCNYNFNNTEKLVFEYDEISFSNVCFYNEKFDYLIAGSNNGDLIYTTIYNNAK